MVYGVARSLSAVITPGGAVRADNVVVQVPDLDQRGLARQAALGHDRPGRRSLLAQDQPLAQALVTGLARSSGTAGLPHRCELGVAPLPTEAAPGRALGGHSRLMDLYEGELDRVPDVIGVAVGVLFMV